jgi:hypothetical protein
MHLRPVELLSVVLRAVCVIGMLCTPMRAMAQTAPKATPANPEVRVFVVDPVGLAAMPDDHQREALGLIKQDITTLATDPAHAPTLGWFLILPTASSASPFDAVWFAASGTVSASDLQVLDDRVTIAGQGGITGALNLPALRNRLLGALDQQDLPKGGFDLAVHVFANQWRTGTSALVAKVSGNTAETSTRPTACFVNDLGEFGMLQRLWPEGVELWGELRPPHRYPTPSRLSLGNMISVLVGGAGKGRSMGIAGPLCPPGMSEKVEVTAMDDPKDCDEFNYSANNGSQIDVCRPDAPVLAGTSPDLVRRPLNLALVDGDAVGTSLQIQMVTSPAGLTPLHLLGSVPLTALSIPDLQQVLPQGTRGGLRAALTGQGCTGTDPLQVSYSLAGPTRTTGMLVTAPVTCPAGSAVDLTFDLFDLWVN